MSVTCTEDAGQAAATACASEVLLTPIALVKSALCPLACIRVVVLVRLLPQTFRLVAVEVRTRLVVPARATPEKRATNERVNLTRPCRLFRIVGRNPSVCFGLAGRPYRVASFESLDCNRGCSFLKPGAHA
eukprot:1194709-Prorocentrum_minimum.AAC.4